MNRPRIDPLAVSVVLTARLALVRLDGGFTHHYVGGISWPQTTRADRDGRLTTQRVAAIPTIGLFRVMPPSEPLNRASPKPKMPPSDATNQ